MGDHRTAEELLHAIATAGYFDIKESDQELFRHVVEIGLNMSANRAVDVLTASGLVTLAYSQDPTAHMKDRIDQWQLVLTKRGQLTLSSAQN